MPSPLRFVRMNKIERAWLDYAWQVVNCPESHLYACINAGAAVPGKGRVDGNDLRLPGYLGRNYRPGGILCVAAVGREPTIEREKKYPVIRRTNANLYNLTQKWIKKGRSSRKDAQYLKSAQICYEEALPNWPRWRRHFRTLVEDYLNMNVTNIAWTNLAKCRVSIDRGQKARTSESNLTRLCQRHFIPIRAIVDILQPVVILVSVLDAGRGGSIVESWDGQSCSPLVYSWQGQSGHDRHNADPRARRLHDWAPDMVREVRSRIEAKS